MIYFWRHTWAEVPKSAKRGSTIWKHAWRNFWTTPIRKVYDINTNDFDKENYIIIKT